MSRRLAITMLLGLALVLGGWLLVHREQISSADDAVRLFSNQLAQIRATFWSSDLTAAGHPFGNPGSLRIASFNVTSFGPERKADEDVLQALAAICTQFDIVAVQAFPSDRSPQFAHLVELMNSNGRNYTLAISAPAGRRGFPEQAAFLFDQSTVQLDHSLAYTVADPDDVLISEPFVGWFRAVNVTPAEAFTFSLVNVRLDARRTTSELPYVQELFRRVRADGRDEDDVILLGNFHAGQILLDRAGKRSGLIPALRDVATNTRFDGEFENLLFDPRATIEYSGNSGAFDFLKYLNITLESALDISEHLPVWAEFSIFEGATAPDLIQSSPLARQ